MGGDAASICPGRLCIRLLLVLRNFQTSLLGSSLTLLQEVESDVKDSRSLPFVTKHPGTWKKNESTVNPPRGGWVGGGKRGDFVKLLLPRRRQSNDGLSKFRFLDLPPSLLPSLGACTVLYNISPTSGSFYRLCPFMVLHQLKPKLSLLESQLLAGRERLQK